MSDVHAALVRSKLLRINDLLEERRELADEYLKGLRPLSEAGRILLPDGSAGRTWYRFAIGVTRPERLMQSLFHMGVQCDRPIEWWPHLTKPYPFARSSMAIDALMRWRGATVGLQCAEAFITAREVIR